MKNVIKIGFIFCLFLVNTSFASNTETEMDETMPLLKVSTNHSDGVVRDDRNSESALHVAQPVRGPVTVQREVLENRDLVRLIGSYLSLNEFRRLALVNSSTCATVRKVYPLDQLHIATPS